MNTRADVGEPPSTGTLVAVVLAAGQGTRMHSRLHKVLHPLAGKTLIERVLELLHQAGADRIFVVVGHQAEAVRRMLPEWVECVVQHQQLGTGHAVRVAADKVRAIGASRVLVHYGDEALVRPASLGRLLAHRVSYDAPIALLNARLANPSGYGRVIRAPDGTIERMVEEIDATASQREVDEIWSGTMLLDASWLWDNLPNLERSRKGEYYLPELVNLARSQTRFVFTALVEDEEEVLGVNDRAQLAAANAVLWRRKIEELLGSGVTVLDPATTYIDPEVSVAPDSTIYPGCHLRGRTRIGHQCEIGPNSFIVDTDIGDRSRVWFSVLEGARVGEATSIGPFSHLRPGAIIGDSVELGNYAEVKASHIGDRTRMHHFSYVGDAQVGQDVNIGAGSITANFDSETGAKSPTHIQDGASIGSDTVLVAPVAVGEGAMTGAGAVVTRNIPAGEVWIGAPARHYRARHDGGPTDKA